MSIRVVNPGAQSYLCYVSVTFPTSRPSRRRRPDDVRSEALAIARRLLLDGGPGAITLKAIGAEMGMSHANLIHHFGSAEALQARLRAELIAEISAAVKRLLEAHAKGDESERVVDRVFDAYADGGLGVLTAWSALSRSGGDTGELAQAFDELAPVLVAEHGGPDAEAKAREVLRLVTLLAFAESMIGSVLPRPRDGQAGDPREFTRRLLHLLSLDLPPPELSAPPAGPCPAND